MTPRKDDIYRLDVKVSKDIYDRIEELAKASGAKVHHISNKPIVSPTVLELISIGLAHYGENVPDTSIGNLPESLMDEKIQAAIAPLKTELAELAELVKK